ncbi:MAG: S-layer family protein [Crocosphaera sp.]|nr:S-layer family protein [Crocosphaera sp.]
MTSLSRLKTFYPYLVSTGIIISQFLSVSKIFAQITVDNTVGSNKIITEDGKFIITGGEQRGSNLFHSFEQFSVPDGTIANFKNSPTINHIINRVTGSSLSNIEGTITANGTANFILINPNGISFGPNAQIKINGSFLASTADSIIFADGVQFSANNPQANPLLTMSVPTGLQFGSNPGAIINRANNLNLKPGNTFALVGGELEFPGGNLSVPQGRVELGSVGNDSKVQLTTTGIGFELGYEGVNNFRDISLSQQASVNANNSIIELQGRNIRLREEAQIGTDTNNSDAAGDMIVNASESIEIIDNSQEDGRLSGTGPVRFSRLSAIVDLDATGSGGNITLNTKRLILQEGGRVSAEIQGRGNGGSIEVNASEFVQIIGTGFFGPSFIATTTISEGNGGPININTKQLILQDGGQILAVSASVPGFVSTGNGGQITINATDLVSVSGSGMVGDLNNAVLSSRITAESGFEDLNLSGFGLGGSVSINTDRLTVTNDGIVSAASLGQGNAGSVQITANSIFLDNQGIITASSEGTGNAGNLTINTDQLTVNNRSQVAVRSIGTGFGGNLTLNARSITLEGKSQLTATSEALDPEIALELGLEPEVLELDNALANAGSLTITTDDLTVNNDSDVTVSSFGLGNAGDINIKARDILLDHSSRLSAETASGEGGNINLNVDKFLILRRNSRISTTAGTRGGTGNGGNINIAQNSPLFIIAVPTENSDIIANAFLGRGGNINIDAAGVFGIEERQRLTPLSDITASSQFGQVGNIGINRPDVDPQRSLVQLPDELVDASQIIVDACRPGGSLTRGEFTITGRGGLPSNPNEGVDHPTGLTELGYPNTNSPNSLLSEPGTSLPSEVSPNSSETRTPSIVEAQGWIINSDGNVVLTAQAPTVTPHSPGLSPVTCYDLSTRKSSP